MRKYDMRKKWCEWNWVQTNEAEHAMALFGLFKMKAESAAATWFIVTDILGM